MESNQFKFGAINLSTDLSLRSLHLKIDSEHGSIVFTESRLSQTFSEKSSPKQPHVSGSTSKAPKLKIPAESRNTTLPVSP